MKRSAVAAVGPVLLLSLLGLACGEPENVCIGECEAPSTETDPSSSSTGGATSMLPATGTTGPGPDPTSDPTTSVTDSTSGPASTTDSTSGPDGTESSSTDSSSGSSDSSSGSSDSSSGSSSDSTDTGA